MTTQTANPATAYTELDGPDLIDAFTKLVCWLHYDPMGAARPNTFDKDELEDEIMRRMDQLDCPSKRALLDEYKSVVRLNHYNPDCRPCMSQRDAYEIATDILRRMTPR